jgi:hypothetical protein
MSWGTNKSGGGSDAPTDATYWVSGANGTLSAEKDVSTLVTNGALIKSNAGSPATAVAETDYKPADFVTSQTVGVGGAQTITISGLTGNSVDLYELEFSGPVGVTGGLTAEINDNATPLTYGGSYVETGVLSGETTYLGQAMAKNLAGLLKVFTRCTSRRMGTCRTVAVRESDTRIQEVLSAFEWANTADEITQFKLVGSAAAYFSQGFKVTVRKRTLGA